MLVALVSLSTAIVVGVADAAPAIVVDRLEVLGGGLYAYEVGVELDDGSESSVFVDLTFKGPYNQNRVGGVDVDDEGEAAAFAAEGGYDIYRDSFFRTASWAHQLAPVSGGAPGSQRYSAILGTGSGVRDYVPLARLVLPWRERIDFTATIARNGESYELVPEPGFPALLGAGLAGLALLARLRRP